MNTLGLILFQINFSLTTGEREERKKCNKNEETQTLRLPSSLGEDIMQRNPSKTVPNCEVCLLADQGDLLLKAVINAASVVIDQQMERGALVFVKGVEISACLQQLLHQ